MDHGVTILDGHGWYTGNEMKVLCILAKKNESVTIFRIVKIIDPNAFVSHLETPNDLAGYAREIALMRSQAK